MLQALETGVKGGRWFSLMDKVWSLRNLRVSFEQVKANDGAAGAYRLMQKVALKISDGDLLDLIGTYLKQKVEDDGAVFEPESGSPQGAVINPLLSNIYLNDLNRLMVREGMEMVRYADDLVVTCRSQ